MDWTDFDADNQARLALNLITRHGRATPLLWLTVDKDELKDQRNAFEDLCLTRLKAILPEGVAVTILADRGFGDVKLFEFLESLGFGYVIRFRGNVHVTAADGETRLAEDWVGKKGRAPSARRRAHCGPPQGRRGGLRPRHGNEGGLASGRQRCDRERVPDRQPLRQTLDDRYRPGMATLKNSVAGAAACSAGLGGRRRRGGGVARIAFSAAIVPGSARTSTARFEPEPTLRRDRRPFWTQV